MENNNTQNYLDILGEVKIEELYIQQAFNYYHQRYLMNQSIQEFVALSDRLPDDIRSNPRIGLCDRTLGSSITNSSTLEGGALRGCLQRFSLFKASGHELFRGCVVFPEIDKNNQYVSAIGYRVAKRIRHWESPIVYWTKPKPEEFITDGMKFVKRLVNG